MTSNSCVLTDDISGLSIGVGLLRIPFPESRQFRERKEKGIKGAAPGVFWQETKAMLAKEWRMCVYAIILMTLFNYYSHTSQDSYTTMMIDQKGLENTGASVASILMKTGACVGGTIMGYMSQFVGRRRTMVSRLQLVISKGRTDNTRSAPLS